MPTTIQNIIDNLTTSSISIENTVDKLICGDTETNVTGIGVTFLATHECIETAKKFGLNLIISHEGIFYSHHGKTDFLKNNSVYEQKSKYIENSGVSIFRYHDHPHRILPDRITMGLLESLDWTTHEIENLPAASIIELPKSSLNDVIVHIKNSLCIDNLRYVGDLNMNISRIGLFVGYRGGGELVIPLIEKYDLDLVIYGEGQEWETLEYVRDAIYQCKNKAIVTLGHAQSEMPGMKYIANKLQQSFPDIPVKFISQAPIFKFI